MFQDWSFSPASVTMARKLESGWLMSAGTVSNSFTLPASMTSTCKHSSDSS